ncbi:MAG: ROK family protein [Gemmatimonadota bacterium]|nr:ROK family protein [Gemmatimonadota bacterium]
MNSNVLVIDVGGTNVKVLATGKRTPIKIPSGPAMTAARMVAAVRKATADWDYRVVSIGYPGPVLRGKPAREPHNLGGGWMRSDFAKAFERPVRMVNDAAMQALGSYEGGTMLFLGLGTGLGSALIVDGNIAPLELAHLPYKHGRTYEEYVGVAALQAMGKRKWRGHVHDVVELLRAGLNAEYVILGGGNAKYLKTLPPTAKLGDNRNAFRGGFRLWRDETNTRASSHRSGGARAKTGRTR